MDYLTSGNFGGRCHETSESGTRVVEVDGVNVATPAGARKPDRYFLHARATTLGTLGQGRLNGFHPVVVGDHLLPLPQRVGFGLPLNTTKRRTEVFG